MVWGRNQFILNFSQKFNKTKVIGFLKLQREESISFTYPHTCPSAILTYAGEHSTGINHYSPCKQVGGNWAAFWVALQNFETHEDGGREGREGKNNFWPSMPSGEWVSPRPKPELSDFMPTFLLPWKGNRAIYTRARSWSELVSLCHLHASLLSQKVRARVFSSLAWCVCMKSYA